MAAKKKTNRKQPHKHAHASHRAHKTNPETPAGMVLVPASMIASVSNPAPKKKRRHHGKKHPHKHNPAPEGQSPNSHLKVAASAVGYGALAALAGLAGGYALKKAGLKSKTANVAANLVASAAIGGAVGMLDRAAGTVVAHNYAVAAGQWAAYDPSAQGDRRRVAVTAHPVPSAPPHAVSSSMPVRSMAPPSGIAPRLLQAAASAFHGPEEIEGYEKLDGVVADSMGAPEDVDGFERLEGVVADSMGDASDVEGFEKLDGIVADDMGDSDELGEEEVGDADDVADLFD